MGKIFYETESYGCLNKTAYYFLAETKTENVFIENNPQPLNYKISEFPEFVDLRHFVKGSLGGDWGKDEAVGNYNQKVLCIRGTDIPFAKLGMKKNIPTRFILNKNLSSRKLKQGDIVLEISGGSPVQSTGRPLLITDKLLSIFENNLSISSSLNLLPEVTTA